MKSSFGGNGGGTIFSLETISTPAGRSTAESSARSKYAVSQSSSVKSRISRPPRRAQAVAGNRQPLARVRGGLVDAVVEQARGRAAEHVRHEVPARRRRRRRGTGTSPSAAGLRAGPCGPAGRARSAERRWSRSRAGRRPAAGAPSPSRVDRPRGRPIDVEVLGPGFDLRAVAEAVDLGRARRQALERDVDPAVRVAARGSRSSAAPPAAVTSARSRSPSPSKSTASASRAGGSGPTAAAAKPPAPSLRQSVDGPAGLAQEDVQEPVVVVVEEKRRGAAVRPACRRRRFRRRGSSAATPPDSSAHTRSRRPSPSRSPAAAAEIAPARGRPLLSRRQAPAAEVVEEREAARRPRESGDRRRRRGRSRRRRRRARRPPAEGPTRP